MTRDSDVTLYVEFNNVTNSRITLHNIYIYIYNIYIIIISNFTPTYIIYTYMVCEVTTKSIK